MLAMHVALSVRAVGLDLPLQHLQWGGLISLTVEGVSGWNIKTAVIFITLGHVSER